MSKQIRISVDAMGGDFAPAEVVAGSVLAAKELGVEIILVGQKGPVEQEMAKHDLKGLKVSFVEAADVIVDGEQAAYAVMRKPNSSMVVAAKMVKEGKADGMMSAGHTGGVMVSALQYVGTLPGIDRPVACGPFLGLAPKTVMLDLGANVGVQPYHLVDFAVAGTVYAKLILGIENPTVGLLSVGAEEGKGNDQTKEAFKLLKQSGLNFYGNVEGHDIPAGKVNVVVCDGFVGNILIKFCEALGRAVSQWIGKELGDKVNPDDLKNTTTKLYRLMSPAAVMGGGPLWGVNGVVSIAHGSSKAPQILGTIKATKQAIESGFVEMLKSELEKTKKLMGK
jgi:glycerol-3-phosphate acyltransferase PlsX